ncbi:MAG: hypothetical protein M5U28_55165 [Sandaracinaceae bacterium]|nr:hypothetical protein [Sandaracinaceae bacterium]
MLSTVLEALVGMGFKQREAQAMVDHAKPHVGHEPTFDQAMRAALREAVLPGRVGGVREAMAEYARLAA